MTARIEQLNAATIVAALNKLVAMAPDVMTALCEHRVRVDKAFADSPGVVCWYASDDQDADAFGMIGVLQAIISPTGKRLVAHYDDREVITKFTLADWPIDPPLLSASEIMGNS